MKTKAKHLELGERGEKIAFQYLLERDFMIKEKNWRRGHLEIDIIAMKDDMLIFVEVKTRFSSYFGTPESAVNWSKQKKLARAANAYMKYRNYNGEARFDVISVILNQKNQSIEHFEDAFYPTY